MAYDWTNVPNRNGASRWSAFRAGMYSRVGAPAAGAPVAGVGDAYEEAHAFSSAMCSGDMGWPMRSSMIRAAASGSRATAAGSEKTCIALAAWRRPASERSGIGLPVRASYARASASGSKPPGPCSNPCSRAARAAASSSSSPVEVAACSIAAIIRLPSCMTSGDASRSLDPVIRSCPSASRTDIRSWVRSHVSPSPIGWRRFVRTTGSLDSPPCMAIPTSIRGPARPSASKAISSRLARSSNAATNARCVGPPSMIVAVAAVIPGGGAGTRIEESSV